jgi:hypothetical protein
MQPRTAATRVPDPDAAEFVRFCYRRRRVGWPELYDEMCAVASRGLYRGYGTDDLAALGIGFALFDMPALAALANRIVAEEQALRRPMTVTIVAAQPEPAATDLTPEAVPESPVVTAPLVDTAAAVEPSSTPSIRFVPVPAGA